MLIMVIERYREPGADHVAQLSQWMKPWSDLVDFEVVPVITSDEASALHR
jgi:hypothetical protein